jgi:EXLDI family protein
MPNKTIYVADDDLPIFERAQELSGDKLSAVIVRALRRFIELEEARKGGIEEFTVRVGKNGDHQLKRFKGMHLVRWVQANSKGKGTKIINVYHTAKKQFALHSRVIKDWDFESGDPDYWGNPKNWGLFSGKFWTKGWDWEVFRESGDYTLQVFERLEELQPHVSGDLYIAVGKALGAPPIEDLDI